MAKTPLDFYTEWLGRGEDIDGTAGIQCVDGWKIFLRWCGFKNYNQMGYAPNGWAESVYSMELPEVKKYFTKITDYRKLQNGDWVIWKRGSKCFPSSHIAMYWNGECFGLNQGSKVFNVKYPNVMQYMLGALRWDVWQNKWVGKKYMRDGVYVVGQQYIDGYWYYFDEKTKEYITGFKKIASEDKTVYYNAKGQMLYGQQYIGKSWYCFDNQTGAMFTGVTKLSNEYEPSGAKTVVYAKNGKMIHGQSTYDGIVYLCDNSTGKLKASWDGKNLKVY